MIADHKNRIAVVSLVASLSLLLAGCGSKDPSPTASAASPTSSASATGGAPDVTDAQGMAVEGETAIGPFGDPCALLTAAEVASATGFTVTGIARGEVINNDSGPAQNCVYVTDGPALAGPLASALGAMSGQDPTALTNAVNAAGGLVGITLTGVDPDDIPTADDTGEDGGDPGITVTMLTDLGPSAAVVSLPNGSAGVAAKGTTQVMLMVLIDGQTSAGGTEQMLRSAYGRVT